ncbi:MAG: replicative DNA helicase [Bacteroidales bacterium]
MAERVNTQKKTTKKKNNTEAIALTMGKLPPQAIDLEEAVLGAAMLEKEVVEEVMDLLSSESFYKDAHRKIFSAISTLSANSEPVDIYTVTEELRRHSVLEEIGGARYLSSLTLKVGSAANVEYHARIIAQKHIQRELIRVSSEIQRKSFEDSTDVQDLMDQAQHEILQLGERNIRREALPLSTIADRVMKHIEELSKRKEEFSGVESGFQTLDRITQGWQKSDFVVIAARPSMGKTAFVVSMARNMALEFNRPVAFFSLEMSSEQLVTRLFMSESGISGELLRSGKLDNEQMKHLGRSINTLMNAPLFIDDTPSLNIYEFRTKVRRLYATQNIQCVIVDYLQIMTGPPDLRGSREQEVAAISRSLKAIAKELNIPIIALAQLNRANETNSNGNKRPGLSNLRESGSIEQDADIVAFIHRPEYYGFVEDDEGNDLRGVAEIIIAKHRNGAVGDVQLRFVKEQAKFTNLNDVDLEAIAPAATIPSRMNLSSSVITSEPLNSSFLTGGITSNLSDFDKPHNSDAPPF